MKRVRRILCCLILKPSYWTLRKNGCFCRSDMGRIRMCWWKKMFNVHVILKQIRRKIALSDGFCSKKIAFLYFFHIHRTIFLSINKWVEIRISTRLWNNYPKWSYTFFCKVDHKKFMNIPKELIHRNYSVSKFAITSLGKKICCAKDYVTWKLLANPKWK